MQDAKNSPRARDEVYPVPRSSVSKKLKSSISLAIEKYEDLPNRLLEAVTTVGSVIDGRLNMHRGGWGLVVVQNPLLESGLQ